jgi:hypothetical protein
VESAASGKEEPDSSRKARFQPETFKVSEHFLLASSGFLVAKINQAHELTTQIDGFH